MNITSNMTQSEIDDAIALKSKNGALMSLRDNYKSIMENIDKKIEREQYRLETWEARQKTFLPTWKPCSRITASSRRRWNRSSSS